MPFKSKAQQRYMYSQHPEIASRWSDEMRGGKRASKSQREHPIKHANLPDRVGKSTSWGSTKKLVIVKPTKLKPQKPIGKAFGDMEDVWHASVGAAKLRNARNARIAGQAAARSEQRRASTVSTNVLNFKATRKNRFPKPSRPSLLGDQQRYGNGSIVGKRWEGEVSKGVLRQSVAPTQARVNPTATMKPRIPLVAKPVTRAVIGKAGIFETARLVPKALKGGWKVGTGSKLKAGLKDTATLNSSRTLQRVGGASKWAAQNRGAAGLSAGVVGGSVIGAGLAHRDVEKAHGDPEDSRYYRLGMGSAALGAGGVGGLEYARRDVKRSTRLARGGSPMAVQNLKHGKVQLVAFESEPGKKVTGRILNPKMLATGQRLARNGYGITRRGAAVGAGGLAALGGAAAMHQRAHERRYN
jgi:hypothetical protein